VTSDVIAAWKRMLGQHEYHSIAKDYYCGRGMKEVSAAVKTLNAEQWIISAGLGLVKASDKIPTYDLTITGNSPSSIKPKITSFNQNIHDWWDELSRLHSASVSLKNLIEKNEYTLIILCLPTTYFNLVKRDLINIKRSKLKLLRLIGPTKNSVPERLQQYLMPYDQRLNGPKSTIKGTQSDFPQRATRHFSDLLDKTQIDPALHYSLVENTLKNYGSPVTIKRARLTDSEITNNIERLWILAQGKSSKMLRILRDEELIACEQKRFSTLFNKVKTIRKNKNDI